MFMKSSLSDQERLSARMHLSFWCHTDTEMTLKADLLS